MNPEKYLGIKDEPILKPDEDYLNLKDHAEILAEFISECDTPLTIGIQGDWGCGKTSMMNMIKYILEEERRNETIKCIWFNTWQYSQFNLDKSLGLSLIIRLIDDIKEQIGDLNRELSDISNKIIDKSKKVINLFANVVLGYLSQGAVQIDEENKDKQNVFDDPSKVIKDFKKTLSDFIKRIIESPKNPVEKFVIFIDDIDRLKPLVALDLLEILKLYLDIKGCVFVLACDYKIVMRGLEEKFGTTGEQDGKNFFDKIIQVPYNIPIHQYKIDSYLEKLLERIGIKLSNYNSDIKDTLLKKYQGLLETSFGNNPRSYKRLFNSFLLLKKVLEYQKRNNKTDYPFKEFEEKGIITEYEKDLIVFATLCLQMKYENLFNYMRTNLINDEWFKKIKEDNIIEENLKKELNIKDENEEYNIKSFLSKFYDAIQLKSDDDEQKLSKEEIEVLKKVMAASNIVGIQKYIDPVEASNKREFIEYYIKLIKERLGWDDFIVDCMEDYDKSICFSTNVDDIYIKFFLDIPNIRSSKVTIAIGLEFNLSQKNTKKEIKKLENKKIDEYEELIQKGYEYYTDKYELYYMKDDFPKNEFHKEIIQIIDDFKKFVNFLQNKIGIKLTEKIDEEEE